METKKNVIVLGSINYDLMISVDRMPKQGETIHGENYIETIGGKGSNQAVAAAKLGAETYLIGAVGNDLYGKKSIEEIKKLGVNTDYIEITDESSTGTAFIITHNNDNRIIVIEGANGNLKDRYVSVLNSYEANDIFLSQLENPITDVKKAINLAKNNGLTTILNPAPAKKLDESIFKKIDYFIVNQTEAEFYTGILPTDKNECIEASKRLIEMGVSNVIITLGKDGCFYMNNIINHYIEGIQIETVDTTGAGDTFIGGFVYGLSNEESIEDSLKYGNVAGALACKKYGAKSSMPTFNELNKFLLENRV